MRIIWRDCEHCGREFSQPDDPGRKRRFCADARKQAAYQRRKRQAEQQRATGSGPASSARSSAAATTPAGSVKSRLANVSGRIDRRRTPAAAVPAPSAAPVAVTATPTPPATTRS
jgi:hypothetical protein